ncbi:ribbon-helix-helix domain-containing protein [Martelella sp. HB161492]|uniref:ribbon-helix-helix domain-containing protein n=1 Tax=Martelella sp. HB161492 TaxID=2720726 RepID=UPI00158FA65C|nr:ribbon-helix-helix domain-containing protein [Martelella sp. HB161492]
MIRKHSVSLHGHKTSFSLEDAFFDELKAIASARDIALAALLREVDDDRPAEVNLSSALRLYVLATLKQQSTHH